MTPSHRAKHRCPGRVHDSHHTVLSPMSPMVATRQTIQHQAKLVTTRVKKVAKHCLAENHLGGIPGTQP